MSYASCFDPTHVGVHEHEGVFERSPSRWSTSGNSRPPVRFYRRPAGHHRHGEHRDPRDINGGPFCCGLTQLGGIGEDDCHICGEPWPCSSSREADDA